MKKIKILVLGLLMLALVSPVVAQDSADYPTREKNPFGIGVYLGGPEVLFGGSVDYFMTPMVSLEAGYMSISLGEFSVSLMHFGLTYSFFGDSTTSGWSPYIGVFYNPYFASVSLKFSDGTSAEGTATAHNFYFPLGMEFVGTSGFTFSLHVALAYNNSIEAEATSSTGLKASDSYGSAGVGYYGGVKLGYHFGL